MSPRAVATARGRPRRFHLAAGGVAFCLLPGLSFELGADAPKPAAPILEEVVVTAQRREEPLLRVPRSVSVLDEARLRDAGVVDLFSARRQIPSLDVVQNTGPLNTAFRIRRIGNEPNIPTFEPAVGLFVDEAYRSRSGVLAGDLFDLERIEVLRGPQSVLYGKNTTAGVIHVITNAPTPTFEAKGELSLGRVEGSESALLGRLEAVLGGALGASLNGRISGVAFDQEPRTTNAFNGDHVNDMRRHAVRAQLAYQPGPGWEILFRIGRQNIDGARSGDAELDPGILVAAINAAYGVPCPSSRPDDRIICRNRAGRVDMDATDLTLTLRRTADGTSWTAVTAFEDYGWRRDFDADQLNIDLVDLVDRQAGRSLAQEFRAERALADGRVRALAGLYGYRGEFRRGDRNRASFILGPEAPRFELAPGLPFGRPGDAGFQYAEADTSHVSLFANATWRLKQAVELSLGARWQADRKQGLIDHSANHQRPTLITVALLPEASNTALSRRTDGVSWNAILQTFPSGSTSVWLSFARGFKSGGFNLRTGGVLPPDREFSDETADSLEAGLDAFLLEDRLRLRGAAFRTRFHDFQSAGFVSLSFLVNNAETVETSGFELDGDVLLGKRLRTGLSLSFARARYVRYSRGACHFGREADNADGSGCDQSGRELPLAPEWVVSAYLQHAPPPSTTGPFARIDWQWTDRYFTNATLDPRHVQSAYSLVNLRLGWRWRRIEVTAWLRNALDETWVVQSGPANLFGRDPAYAQFLGEPRNWGVTIRYVH